MAWSRGYVGSDDTIVTQIAVDAAGEVLTLGRFWGTVDLGTGPLHASPASGSSVFIAKYDCAGNPIWTKGYGYSIATNDWVHGMTTDASGAIFITGEFSDNIDFGCGQLTSTGDSDGFIAKLDASGTCVYSRSFGSGLSYDVGRGIALDTAGNVLVTGTFGGTTNFGGGSVTSNGANEMFLLKLDPTGSFVSLTQLGQTTSVFQMVGDASGNLVFCGSPSVTTIDFGGGALPSAAFFLAKLNADGTFAWSKGIGGAATTGDACETLTTDASGDVIFGGTYVGSVDLGGGPLPTASDASAYVAKLTGDGAFVFGLGSATGESEVTSVITDASGNVFLTGDFDETLAFGGTPLQVSGFNDTDVFVVGLGPDGSFVSSAKYGDVDEAYGLAIALSPAGSPIVGGWYAQTIDFGNGMLPATPQDGGEAFFLAQLGP